MSSVKLSCDTLESFVGDVRPIWVESEEKLGRTSVKWACEGDAVKMKKFTSVGHAAFAYGVLVTFMEPGEATVTAKYGDDSVSCRVVCRERRDFSDSPVNYYTADFHLHTSSEHGHDAFGEIASASIARHLEHMKTENLRDIAAIADHAVTTNSEAFFDGFKQYEEKKDDMDPIIYPGCENEISYVECDRYGRVHRRSGELLAINSDSFCLSSTYEEFLYKFKDSPFAIGAFAHPHIPGFSTNGIWDYRPRLNNSEPFRKLIKGIEVLGNPNRQNMLHEYVYTEALDAGFRLAPWCNSDQHNNWRFDSYPGSTFVMAPEKTREAITDALLNLRVYACESGNIKLAYKVNGLTAPADIPLTDKYHFEVKIDYVREDPATRPIRCEVISNGGVTVKTIENAEFENFEFDVESTNARWFYLRFVDSNTHRTFSAPVFCGREVIPYVIDDLKPIDKKLFKIEDAKFGTDASMLIDDDTYTVWTSQDTTCELVIDMGEIRSVSGLGNYAVGLDSVRGADMGVIMGHRESVFPLEYVISLSTDGKNFGKVAEGLFRTFAGEEIVRFEKTNARYVKLSVLSTTGKRLGREPYQNNPMKIAELSLFEE